MLPSHPLDQKWQSTSQRIWIQVDCRSVAELVAGRAVLEPQEHAAVFRRIVRNIVRLHTMQVCSLTDLTDFVVWSPREFNTVADHSANAAMDQHQDFVVEHTCQIQAALKNKSNLRLCVDGGRRSEFEGALGFALYSASIDESGTYSYTVLARQEKQLHRISSAFVAEAMALDWSLEYLVGLLCRFA
jgi:hypothetical protein